MYTCSTYTMYMYVCIYYVCIFAGSFNSTVTKKDKCMYCPCRYMYVLECIGMLCFSGNFVQEVLYLRKLHAMDLHVDL